jgi:hypothetical protein
MSNGTITIINTKPYNLQQVPEVGKDYHIFDDGKIKLSRHYIAKIVELISPEDAKDITDLVENWEQEKSECPWLFAETTDYFVRARSESYDINSLYFVRTVDGGWFSVDFPNIWMGARLDIDGSLYEKMKEWYNVEE